MRFNFQLRQMGAIAPWHDADGSRAHLGWFGLTDGWYWIAADTAELFRYSQPLVDQWTRESPDATWLEALPYVDYQVSRLWEDVLDLLPEVLDPVPPQLARALGPEGRWTAWGRAAKAAVERVLTKQEGWDLLEAAAGWWWTRALDTLYLQAGPQIWFWSDGTDVHVQWDNRGLILDGLPAWTAVLGEQRVPVADFIMEVQAFDARFMARMRDRIALAQVKWARPDVALDPRLDQEQVVRSRRLAQRFGAVTTRGAARWNVVCHAIARIEALPGFASEQGLKLA